MVWAAPARHGSEEFERGPAGSTTADSWHWRSAQQGRLALAGGTGCCLPHGSKPPLLGVLTAGTGGLLCLDAQVAGCSEVLGLPGPRVLGCGSCNRSRSRSMQAQAQVWGVVHTTLQRHHANNTASHLSMPNVCCNHRVWVACWRPAPLLPPARPPPPALAARAGSLRGSARATVSPCLPPPWLLPPWPQPWPAAPSAPPPPAAPRAASLAPQPPPISPQPVSNPRLVRP